MSDRPTISVYINGKLVDIGYYKNWYEKSVFIEAIAIAALYKNCANEEEYHLRKYGTAEKIKYELYPKEFDGTEEFLKSMERCSELPTIVDITAKCIYVSYDAPLSAIELNVLPSILDNKIYFDNPRGLKMNVKLDETEKLLYLFIDFVKDFAPLGSGCKLPYDKIDMERVLHLIYDTPEFKENISADTFDEIFKRFGSMLNDQKN